MFKNIARLMAGGGIGQLIQFASIPILTRLYSPEDFGLFAIAIAVSGILVVISSLQLNVALISLNSKASVLRLLPSAFLLNIIMLFTSTVLILIANLTLYNGKLSLLLVVFILLITLFSSFNNVLKGVFVFSGLFSSLSKVYIFRSIIIVSLQFLFVLIQLNHGLIVGLLVGEFCMLIIMMSKQSNFFTISNRTFKHLFLSLKRLKTFTVYGTFQELVSVAIFWLPLAAITIFFGNSAGGEFSVSARILWPATILITGSIAHVLHHRMVNIPRDELVGEVFLSHYPKLIFIPLSFVVYYLTPIMFGFILNDEWVDAINISKYVALLCIVFMYVLPFRVTFRVLRLQKKQLIIEVFVFLFLLVLFSSFDFESIDSVFYTLIIVMLGQAFTLEYVIRKSIKSDV